MPALSSYPDRVLTRALGHDSGNLVGKTRIREILTADRPYFVRTDGSDSNTGLVNSSGGAKLTFLGAYNDINNLIDFAGFTVTISMQNTAWAAQCAIFVPWVGGG